MNDSSKTLRSAIWRTIIEVLIVLVIAIPIMRVNIKYYIAEYTDTQEIAESTVKHTAKVYTVNPYPLKEDIIEVLVSRLGSDSRQLVTSVVEFAYSVDELTVTYRPNAYQNQRFIFEGTGFTSNEVQIHFSGSMYLNSSNEWELAGLWDWSEVN